MSSGTGKSKAWTKKSMVIHFGALRKADQEMALERDRRYTEGAGLRAEALKIKETADLAALTLARESQTYKEQQADAMRDKTLGESGLYATNSSVTHAIAELKGWLQPFVDYVAADKGKTKGSEVTWNKIYATIAAIAGVAAVFYYSLPHK